MNRFLHAALLPLARQCGSKLLVKNELVSNPFLLRRMITSVEHSDAVAKYLKDHEIKVEGLNPPPPALSFEDANIPENILQHVTRQFDSPTPIQSQVRVHVGGLD